MARPDLQSTAFPTPSGVRLVVEIGSGTVLVDAVDTVETRIEAESRRGGVLEVAQVQDHDGSCTIFLRSKKRTHGEHDIKVACPSGADLDVTTGSAELIVHGMVGSIAFRAGSGDLVFEEVATDVNVKLGSGDVVGRTIGGTCSMHGASGDVRVGEVGGDLVMRTSSGDGTFGHVGGDVTVTTVSGDVRIDRIRSGTANIRAVSGDVEVGIAPGSRVFLDLVSTSGDARSDLTPAEGPGEADVLELNAASVSGDIRVRRSKA